MQKDSLHTIQNRVHEAVFGFKEAGSKLGVTTWVPRFMQSSTGSDSFNILTAFPFFCLSNQTWITTNLTEQFKTFIDDSICFYFTLVDVFLCNKNLFQEKNCFVSITMSCRNIFCRKVFFYVTLNNNKKQRRDLLFFNGPFSVKIRFFLREIMTENPPKFV